MSKASIDLGDVAETLLLTLYFRAVESQHPDALVKDEQAIVLMNRIDYDFSRFRRQLFDLVPTILRVRQFDRYTRAFLAEHPDGRVVQIGCGLDTRFERVDNGRVEWYDLDLPNVIALRRQLLPETSRCHFIGCSVLDFAWMDTLANKDSRPALLLAEGVFPYFEEVDVKRLILALQERFPGAESIFDAMSPFLAWLHNLELAAQRLEARLHWGLRQGRELEAWSPGIRLLDEWFYYDEPEPRLGAHRLLGKIPPVGGGYRVVRYRLGTLPVKEQENRTEKER
jgi:O-methyltransferase involved in polyketide biosynthesis